MDSQNNTVPINTSEIINIVRRSLSKIDPRLIDHGERVGYIATKICDELKDGGGFDRSVLFVLCTLHDIGAYKTEEIDNMVRFETDKYHMHSLYGYLFLKGTQNLAEYAEAILFHHTDYTDEALRASRSAGYAELINIADRTDILMSRGFCDLSQISRLSGTKFNPEYVDALCLAEAKTGLSDLIARGGYHEETEKLISSIRVNSSDVISYLKLLVYAIDFRSPYTVTHTADTTIISLMTGKLLGLGEHDLNVLYTGAFLHDIGKLAIPYSILEKPGKLTPEEFEIVKRHIPEGEAILRGVINDEICDIALRHHEKLDGSGYSRGLSGNMLTLPQRIVAAADIFSALSQERSYKKQFSRDDTIRILNNMRDTGKLCPLVVNTMCDNYEYIINGTVESHDPVKTIYSSLTDEFGRLKEMLGVRTE